MSRRTVRGLALATIVATLLTWVAPPAGAQTYAESVGEAAMEMIDFPVADLGWTVHFLPGRVGYLGLAVGPKRRVEIYVRPEHSSYDVAHTLAHELGHAVDMTYGSPYRRDIYRSVRGISADSAWFGCDECTDYATPAGDFAEVFEYWLLGAGGFESRVASTPSAEQLALIEPLFTKPPDPSVRMFWEERWTGLP